MVKRVFIEQIMIKTCNDDMKTSSFREMQQHRAKKVKKIEDFLRGFDSKNLRFFQAIFSGRLVWSGLVGLVGLVGWSGCI
jgi:hypothetical protein